MENTTKANGMRVNAQATALVHNIIAWCVAARGAMGASKVNAWFTQPTAFTVLTSRVINMKKAAAEGLKSMASTGATYASAALAMVVGCKVR